MPWRVLRLETVEYMRPQLLYSDHLTESFRTRLENGLELLMIYQNLDTVLGAKGCLFTLGLRRGRRYCAMMVCS